jgi:hypothetical protein
MARNFKAGYDFRSADFRSQPDRWQQAPGRGHRPAIPAQRTTGDGERECSRQPPELCDGAELAVQPDGTAKRVPARTPRAFCQPCEDRITASLRALPEAYLRLAAAIGDPARTTRPVRTAPGSKVLVNPDIDALMRRMSGILAGWAARVRHIPGLELSDPEHAHGDPRGVAENCKTLATHATPLLALQAGWTTRVHSLPEGRPGTAAVTAASTCRRCHLAITRSTFPRKAALPERKWWVTDITACPVGPCGATPGDHQPGDVREAAAPVYIPDSLEDEIGDEEIVQIGDTWVKVMTSLAGADAGNEILDLHYKARRILGETKTQPESFDGIPCRRCPTMTLERAEPPSNPELPANHSKCPSCGDEMSRKTFDEWADTYAQWSQTAGITVCKRCSLATPKHEECSWALCSCTAGAHPRRRAAA